MVDTAHNEQQFWRISAAHVNQAQSGQSPVERCDSNGGGGGEAVFVQERDERRDVCCGVRTKRLGASARSPVPALRIPDGSKTSATASHASPRNTHPSLRTCTWLSSA